MYLNILINVKRCVSEFFLILNVTELLKSALLFTFIVSVYIKQRSKTSKNMYLKFMLNKQYFNNLSDHQ